MGRQSWHIVARAFGGLDHRQPCSESRPSDLHRLATNQACLPDIVVTRVFFEWTASQLEPGAWGMIGFEVCHRVCIDPSFANHAAQRNVETIVSTEY